MLIDEPVAAATVHLVSLVPCSGIGISCPRALEIPEIVYQSIIGRGAHALQQFDLLLFEPAIDSETFEIYSRHGLRGRGQAHATATQADSDNAGSRYES